MSGRPLKKSLSARELVPFRTPSYGVQELMVRGPSLLKAFCPAYGEQWGFVKDSRELKCYRPGQYALIPIPGNQNGR